MAAGSSPTVAARGKDRARGTATAKPSHAQHAAAAFAAVDSTYTGATPSADPAFAAAREDHVVATRVRDPERYAILGEHARGGLGCVSRAHDRELGRDVAIKELITRGDVSEVRFMREALITARLEHPGIVPVHEAGRWPDGTPFYAMKLVAGRPLRELIAERGTVEHRIGLLHHVIAVADAMAYAHGRNIIHRDLKPANVIVGEFGETVVIDWGLAKDLSAPDAVTGAPARLDRSDELTATGNVLGTPAYMAPEQQRGERVDQRADVFAIGAMLWELCALRRVPPVDRAVRRRVLRRAGVDPDLIAIIEKALEANPALRYPHAGALAADLKAFKAGARISARGYSLVALLAHWARRHRGTAISIAAVIAAALAVALVSGALYVRSIAAERDRLMLGQAERLLHSDPRAAFHLLDRYRGRDAQQLAMLRARARGLGVAELRAQPHTQTIYLAHALADGTLLTLGEDGTVVKTTPDGGTRIVARGVAPQYTFAYSEARQLLAYACNATGICVLDVQRETLRPAPADRLELAPTCLGFSPDNSLLAALSPRGELAVWQVGDGGAPTLRYAEAFDNGEQVRFVDDATVVVETTYDVHIVHLPPPGRSVPDRPKLSIAGVGHSAASARLHLVAAATARGSVMLVDSESHRTVLDRPVCRGTINRIALVASPPTVVYACQDGEAGMLDVERDRLEVLAHLDGGATRAAASEDGRYLMFGGTSGELVFYDTATRMLHRRLGHSTRITVLTPPTLAFPYVISGDASGALLQWPLPDTTVWLAATTATRLIQAAPLARGGPLIAAGYDTAIPWVAGDGRAGELAPHGVLRDMMALSPSRSRFAMYGTDDAIELWSVEPEPRLDVIRTGHAAVTAVGFAPGDQLVVGTRDGALVRWSSGATRELGSIHESVARVRAVPHSATAVVAGASGALWLAGDGPLRALGTEPDAITALACSPDGRWLVAGTAIGTISLYELATRARTPIVNARAWIEFVGFSSDSRQLMYSTNGRMQVAAIDHADRAPRLSDADRIALPAHFATFSPDNAWLAATGDHGDLWFHRACDDRWVYVVTGIAQLSQAMFSEDGAQLVATDPSGRALVVDMRAPAFH